MFLDRYYIQTQGFLLNRDKHYLQYLNISHKSPSYFTWNYRRTAMEVNIHMKDGAINNFRHTKYIQKYRGFKIENNKNGEGIVTKDIRITGSFNYF